MSRIGKQPVEIPEEVKVDLKDTTISVDGPKGKIAKTFVPAVKIEKKGNTIFVSPAEDSRFSRAMYGTARSIIAGMVRGAFVGYVKELEIQGVGFKATLKGKQLVLSLGFSHPILYDIPENIKVTIVDGTKLKVEGADKQLVGQVTADIRAYYPPEPYKGKGVRIVGEFAERVRRKEGKAVA